MRRKRIEIPVIIIAMAIMSLIVLSGNLVYKSISEILESWNNELKLDRKMVLVNELIADIDDLENSVKLYSLSKKHIYFSNYYEKKIDIKKKLDELQRYSIQDTVERKTVDSLLILSEQKMKIWEEILDLYLARIDEHRAFAEYHQKIDTIIEDTDTINLQKTAIIIPATDTASNDSNTLGKDTINEQHQKKKGFLKRWFGKKEIQQTKMPPPPPPPIEIPQTVIVDRSMEKAALQKEVKKLENEISSGNKIISRKAALLMQQNLAIKNTIEELITKLEKREKQNEQIKSEAANRLASKTYKRLINFAATVFLLLVLVLIIIFRYLKKSRAYQEALKEAKDNAEQLALAKKMFTATVSHEMRTPVNVIHGLSEQLLQKDLDEKDHKNIEVIYKSSGHLNNLVSNTFDLTRIENQHFFLEPINFRLDNLLERIILYNNQAAISKRIRLLIDQGKTKDTVLYDDERRLEQILNNLIANAIKFTDKGSVTLKTDIKTENNKEWLIFDVSDTGIGISGKDKERIFSDFVQLETDPNKQTGGIGLGLYISKKLIELLDGNISVNSKLGVGSTFRVKIPYKKGDTKKIKHTIKHFSAPAALKHTKVLIVDDDEFNRHLLKNIFEKWNIDFNEAENGLQAIELTKTNTYSIIMMDIRMPVMSGTEAVGKLIASGIKTKIIALSANNNIHENIELFDAFIEKPFNEAKLFSTITNILENEPVKIPQSKETSTSLCPANKDLMLMANGDKNFLKEMIEIFIKTSQNNLDLMEQNINTGNNEAIADIAHKMASPVKQMDITEAYKTIKSIEKMAEDTTDLSEIKSIFEKLKIQIETVNKHLQILMKKNFDDN